MSLETRSLFSAGALLLLCVACTPKEAPPGPPPMQEGIEPLTSRAESAPQIGELFPDVTILSDTGEPVNIRALAGKKPYTVLTLGCLT